MSIPERMKAVLLTGHGGLEKLVYREDVPVPQLARGEVLVRVGAAGVNTTDINTRTGWYSKVVSNNTKALAPQIEALDKRTEGESWAGAALNFPRIQGADVCGHIVRASEDVDPKRIGERVIIEPCLRATRDQSSFNFSYFGSECDGGFAQYAKVVVEAAHKIDSVLSDAELASFPCAYSTAENLLTRSRVAAGERVLITGASGGVGSAAIQLARRRGAKIIAVASTSKAHKVMALGASNVIPRGSSLITALGPNSVDVVIDVVGGQAWSERLDVLVPGGRYATSGAIAGPMVEMDLRTLYLKDISLFGCTRLDSEVFINLIEYIERSDIQPVIAQTFPLRDIAEAQETFLLKKHTGKIVLIPPVD